ncbi:Chaperone protein dnaJ 10 [Symbiodinium microadriaticum]|uniref:Chaperone protein dnaJ 10 n=1 Tax=Symbiodinium microadriaticum TaxID=2951 RepID=A0A1Q9E525_SYMMI|nr:Chaperone protein dnaJ 10 [Symbiodinium microadriaticum]
MVELNLDRDDVRLRAPTSAGPCSPSLTAWSSRPQVMQASRTQKRWMDSASVVAAKTPEAVPGFLAETVSSRMRRDSRPKSAEPRVREALRRREGREGQPEAISRCSSASQSPRSGPVSPRSKFETQTRRRECRLGQSLPGGKVMIIPPQAGAQSRSGGAPRTSTAGFHTREHCPKAPPPSPGAGVRSIDKDLHEETATPPAKPSMQDETPLQPRQASSLKENSLTQEESASPLQSAVEAQLLPSCKPLSPIREVSENALPKARERSRDGDASSRQQRDGTGQRRRGCRPPRSIARLGGAGGQDGVRGVCGGAHYACPPSTTPSTDALTAHMNGLFPAADPAEQRGPWCTAVGQGESAVEGSGEDLVPPEPGHRHCRYMAHCPPRRQRPPIYKDTRRMSPGPELDCSLATTRRPSADARDEVEEPGFGLRSEHRSKLTDVEIAEIEKNMPPEYPSIQGEDVQARPGSVHHLRKTTIAKGSPMRRMQPPMRFVPWTADQLSRFIPYDAADMDVAILHAGTFFTDGGKKHKGAVGDLEFATAETADELLLAAQGFTCCLNGADGRQGSLLSAAAGGEGSCHLPSRERRRESLLNNSAPFGACLRHVEAAGGRRLRRRRRGGGSLRGNLGELGREGHCKKLKPDWDKLASKWNKADSNAIIVDVDCTMDNAKDLCAKYGVQGYPTLKYFSPSTSPDGDPYEDARDLKALNKFVKRAAKMPCVPDTGENCDKKDNAYLEEIKEMAADKMKEEKTRMQKEMDDLEAEYKAASDLFEKQKEEAMATMKKQEDLKKSLSKLKDKTNYKIAILKAKTGDKVQLASASLLSREPTYSHNDPMSRDTCPEAGQFPTDVAVYDAEQAARHEALALRLQEQQEREQAEVEMLKAAVGSVFSVRKPRDAVAGTASGLKTMARGVGVGLASLVVQPYVGAKCGGIKGFAKGCGTGLATCVGSTVAGTVVGSGQIVRGVVNTPGAILRTARGEVWNSDARKWEKDWYSLPEEAAEVLCEDCEEAGGESRARSSGSTSRKVQHTELYNVLGVRPEASEADIRRAFYKKSLALHPDKNPDNPEATKQFQEVSDAYRILGDEERRRAYDELGKDTAAASLPKIEPVVFFAALFGTHHFEPFVGRPRLAQDIDMDLQLMMRDIIAEDEESGQIDALKVSRAHKRMLALERRRQVQCAVNLASRLDAHQDEGWEEAQRAEAKRLSQVPSGPEMLYLIGWLYVNGAEQWLAGSAAARLVAKMQAKAHLMKSKGELAASAGRTAFTVNSIMKTAERKKTKQSVQREAKEKEEKAEKAAPDAATGAFGPGEAPSGAKAKTETEEGMRSSQDAQEGNSSPSKAPAEGRGKLGSAEDILSPGTIVVLCNLRTNAELNDEVGVIEEFDESSGRYVVHFLSDGLEPRRLRAENLLILEDSASRSQADSKDSTGGSASGEDPKSTPRAEDTSEDAHWAPGGDEAEVAEAFKAVRGCCERVLDPLWDTTSRIWRARPGGQIPWMKTTRPPAAAAVQRARDQLKVPPTAPIADESAKDWIMMRPEHMNIQMQMLSESLASWVCWADCISLDSWVCLDDLGMKKPASKATKAVKAMKVKKATKAVNKRPAAAMKAMKAMKVVTGTKAVNKRNKRPAAATTAMNANRMAEIAEELEPLSPHRSEKAMEPGCDRRALLRPRLAVFLDNGPLKDDDKRNDDDEKKDDHGPDKKKDDDQSHHDTGSDGHDSGSDEAERISAASSRNWYDELVQMGQGLDAIVDAVGLDLSFAGTCSIRSDESGCPALGLRSRARLAPSVLVVGVLWGSVSDDHPPLAAALDHCMLALSLTRLAMPLDVLKVAAASTGRPASEAARGEPEESADSVDAVAQSQSKAALAGQALARNTRIHPANPLYWK